MQSWGCAQSVQGLCSQLHGVLPLLLTQIGICSSKQVETCELPPLLPTPLLTPTLDSIESFCSHSQGFQRSPQLGGLEQQIFLDWGMDG